MLLDLKRIAREPGSQLPFTFQMDLSQMEWNGQRPVSQPVHVEGSVRNMAGVLMLQASMVTTLHLLCDRCAQPFSREKAVDFQSMLAEELENEENDEIILLGGDMQLDVEQLLGEVFLLNMDTKNLCSQDCKGLCPGCGADLNHETCRCKKEIDPRLSKLAQLLDSDRG